MERTGVASREGGLTTSLGRGPDPPKEMIIYLGGGPTPPKEMIIYLGGGSGHGGL